jgi:hypothetical protein
MTVEQEVFPCEGFGQFTFEVGLVAGLDRLQAAERPSREPSGLGESNES